MKCPNDANIRCGSYTQIYDHNDKKYNGIKECLSISYLGTICSYLDVTYEVRNRAADNNKIDLTIQRFNKYNEDGWIKSPRIDFQMKTTSVPKYSCEYLNYNVNRETFEALSGYTSVPHILAILVLPEDVDKWVTITTDKLIVTEKMYWYNISTSDMKINGSQKNITLKIPLTNIINKESLTKMLDLTSSREVIENGKI